MKWADPVIAYRLGLEKVSHLELADSPTFLQTGFWGAFKSREGWSDQAFHLFDPDGGRSNLLVLHRTLPGGFNLAYVPQGPMGSWFRDGADLSGKLAALAKALHPYFPRNTLFLRFDLMSGTELTLNFNGAAEEDVGASGGLWPGETFPPALTSPLVKSVLDVQPPDTVILDLSGSFDDVLARMKKKTRYNLRLAEKKGVEIAEGSLEDLADWYRLYQETAVRDRIALHSFDYYRDLFAQAQAYEPDPPQVKLLLARYQGQLLAGNVVLLHRDQGVYLYGASSNEHRNLMPTYALQGRSIQIAQAAGCRTFDLFGIPPRDDPSHPMHGLYRFKVGFGGTLHHRHGAWDYPYLPFMYWTYRWAEKARVWYYKKFKKR